MSLSPRELPSQGTCTEDSVCLFHNVWGLSEEDLKIGREAVAEVWGCVEASPLIGLKVKAGCWLRPWLDCPLEHVHCGFSIWSLTSSNLDFTAWYDHPKRMRQKSLALYGPVLEITYYQFCCTLMASHHKCPVCFKGERYRARQLMKVMSMSHCRQTMWDVTYCCIHLWKATWRKWRLITFLACACCLF